MNYEMFLLNYFMPDPILDNSQPSSVPSVGADPQPLQPPAEPTPPALEPPVAESSYAEATEGKPVTAPIPPAPSPIQTQPITPAPAPEPSSQTVRKLNNFLAKSRSD